MSKHGKFRLSDSIIVSILMAKIKMNSPKGILFNPGLHIRNVGDRQVNIKVYRLQYLINLNVLTFMHTSLLLIASFRQIIVF